MKNLEKEYLTAVQVILLGPVVCWTNKFDFVQNMIFDRTSCDFFVVQQPDPNENPELISYHYLREMCIKAAIGKTGYYYNNIVVVGTQNKLYIQVNNTSNKIEQCGPTTKDMCLEFNRKRVSKSHMNINVYLALGYKQKKQRFSNQTRILRGGFNIGRTK